MNTQTLSAEELAARTERARSRVMIAVEADAPGLVHRHRRRVAFTVAAAGVAALALTAGTLAVVQASREQTTYSVQCYSHASVSSTFATAVESAATDAKTGRTLERPTADPVSTCGDMWRMGLVGHTLAPGQDPNAANFPVPKLVACKTANGVGGAFPREGSVASETDFCDSLGLTPWTK